MTQIIAEVGSNWSTFEDAKDSIPMARNCGADAVKFQLFDYGSLFGLEGPRDFRIMEHPKDNLALGYSQLDDQASFQKVYEASMPPDWLPKLKEKADACGIEFMCTAFSPEGYDVVNPLVKRHKIASAELTHKRILQKVNSFRKPVILSTGASGEADIIEALRLLSDCPVTLLYCVANYPATAVDLEVMCQLRTRFQVPVGFSDHSLDQIEIPRHAVGYGATVIEKHFKIRDNDAWPDNGHALLPSQFKLMASVIRGKHKANIGASGEENEMITKHNRRLIAIRDIQPGETLKEGENFGIYRSLKEDTNALSGFLIDEMNGKAVKSLIKAGDGIGPFAF